MYESVTSLENSVVRSKGRGLGGKKNGAKRICVDSSHASTGSFGMVFCKQGFLFADRRIFVSFVCFWCRKSFERSI